jgi:hypothetical protein
MLFPRLGFDKISGPIAIAQKQASIAYPGCKIQIFLEMAFAPKRLV